MPAFEAALSPQTSRPVTAVKGRHLVTGNLWNLRNAHTSNTSGQYARAGGTDGSQVENLRYGRWENLRYEQWHTYCVLQSQAFCIPNI